MDSGVCIEMAQETLRAIQEKAAVYFRNSRGSHDWSHTERVSRLCLKIGEKEGADLEILEIAALLHDIGREEQDRSKGKVCHAAVGARIARTILEEVGMEPAKLERIIHCIQTHRFRGNKQPETAEAKVLFDADKLDSIGAVGIGRAFLFAGEVGAKVHNNGVDFTKTSSYSEEDTAYREFSVKLRKVKDRMLTAEGKRIAKERHAFMEQFFNRLHDEVEGRL
jgi:uncharacterized protein